MRVPPHAFFVVSALGHNLGPAWAVLLFRHVDVLGVAWLRIASAALVFAVWRRPWRHFRRIAPRTLRTLVGLGVLLAAMNACYYEAIARLPLGTVAGIEFLGPVALAAVGMRSLRNFAALLLVIGGVWLLTDVRLASQPVGILLAFANCALFVLYITMGHRIAQDGGAIGVDRLGAAMLVAVVAITPFGIKAGVPAFRDGNLLAAGFGVGVSSSVIPYVCDQMAMARLSRSTFALLLALLPAVATVVGALVLRQVPSAVEAVGVLLVVGGVAVHRQSPEGMASDVPHAGHARSSRDHLAVEAESGRETAR